MNFDKPHEDCLGKCFDVLVSNLSTVSVPGAITIGDAEVAFCKCCELCKKALEIAKKQEKV